MSITAYGKLGITEGDDESISVVYRVVTDGTDEPGDILASSLIPQKGDRYTEGSILTCLSRSCSADEEAEKNHWRVTVKYGMRDAGNTSGTIIFGGGAERVQSLSFSERLYDKVAEEGYLDDETTLSPITNSAGDPFDPPPVVQIANVVLHLVQREAVFFNPVAAVTLLNTINSAIVRVVDIRIPARCGRLLKVAPQLQSDGKYETAYDIEIAGAVKFSERFVDRGYRYLDGNNRLREIRLSDINPAEYGEGGDSEADDKFVSDPVNLDGSGGIIFPGGTVQYREYRLAEERDWNTELNLVRRAP